MKSSNEVEKILKNTRVVTSESADNRILTDASQAFIESTKSRPAASASDLTIWRKIMRSKISKLAVAAVVIIAVMLGIDQFGGSTNGASVAWAKVAEKFDILPAFVNREKRTATSDGKEVHLFRSDVVGYYHPEYGLREDMQNEDGLLLHKVYSLWQEKKSITIQPALKQYKVVALDNAKIEQFWANLKQLVKPIKSGQYTELGRREIDGIEVEGIEISDPNIMAGAGYPIKFDSLVIHLWADVETSLLYRLEAEATSTDKYLTQFTDGRPVQIKSVTWDFQWDAELDKSIFEPNIPNDYTLLPQ